MRASSRGSSFTPSPQVFQGDPGAGDDDPRVRELELENRRQWNEHLREQDRLLQRGEGRWAAHDMISRHPMDKSVTDGALRFALWLGGPRDRGP